MPTSTWQKSSYCGEGESCVHIAANAPRSTVHLTESADPTNTTLTITPHAFRALLRTLKTPEKETHRV
ncbi:hypothetical protein GCM10010145_69290 [Streptomyces ruber]|uniref:DUF397 domain-containing protein n=1 Tax=Streptomyces ruber TaxID=83378 RepID=A0A918EYA3_9ACTN|nr:DUF397 domain-containing protein [Streptomyces ruber]GGQ90009.1 hypothetical protein GCM10010145_69290 [Streptomyces ruber]